MWGFLSQHNILNSRGTLHSSVWWWCKAVLVLFLSRTALAMYATTNCSWKHLSWGKREGRECLCAQGPLCHHKPVCCCAMAWNGQEEEPEPMISKKTQYASSLSRPWVQEIGILFPVSHGIPLENPLGRLTWPWWALIQSPLDSAVFFLLFSADFKLLWCYVCYICVAQSKLLLVLLTIPLIRT